jgi:hypothetical protein
MGIAAHRLKQAQISPYAGDDLTMQQIEESADLNPPRQQ